MCFQSEVAVTKAIMTKWLVVQKDYGQLGNRLHTHANALAFAIEHDLNLLNLSFTEQAKGFSHHNGLAADRHLPQAFFLRLLLSLPKVVPLLQRLALSDRHLAKLGNRLRVIERHDDETLEEQDLFNALVHSPSSRILLIRSWDINCSQTLEKKASEIRRRLSPRQETQKAVAEIIDSMPSHDLLVGLHARRGDYATWLDGRHYHSWEQYADWLHQTHRLLLQHGRKPAYLLCSDESPPKGVFSPLPVVIGQRDSMTDLYALASSRLLLGPPSSFGSWASFYGNVPRITLSKSMQIDALEALEQVEQC